MALLQEVDYGTPAPRVASTLVTLEIDGQSVTVPQGTSVMRAAMSRLSPPLLSERMVQAVPRSAFQGVDDIKPGMQFQAQSPDGIQLVTVVSVEGDEVTLDGNHPMAGITLIFDVEITDVRDATAEELDHGHVHGPGGHHH